MPLSEEEQRILQEMEQKLREHDREFVDRVSHPAYRLEHPGGLKWSILGFVAGTALLLGTFRASIALGICGVLIMTISALAFAQHLGFTSEASGDEADGVGDEDEHAEGAPRRGRTLTISEEWSEMRRRMRARFGHRD